MSEYKLADRLNGLEESATLALNAKAKLMASSGQTVYNLSIGELPCATPDYIAKTVASKLSQNKYTSPAGLPQLRELIAEETKTFYGLDWINQSTVMATASVKPGLYLALLTLINPGDEVILPKPYWFSYKYEIDLIGATAVDVNLDSNFDLDVQAIEKSITAKTKAIVISSPGNPTAAAFSERSLEQLAELLRDRDIFVIIDDIYAKLVFDKNFKPVPTYGFENMVILGGFSKSQALSGWRIGYMIAEPQIIHAATKIQSHILGNPSVPAQYAAIAALENGDQPVMLEELKSNRDFLMEKLASAGNIVIKKPDGAFYGWLDIRQITDNSQDWCDKLLEQTGVAVVPGEAFFTPGFVRLNFAADQKILGPALDLIIQFAKKGSNYA